jgi:predicted metal-dependent RNase
MHSISRYSRSHELVAVSYAAMGTARRATRERARIMAEEREVRQRRGRASARVVVTAENFVGHADTCLTGVEGKNIL